MAISPALAAALIGGLGEVPQSIGTLMPTALDKGNRKRRQELERRATLGLLGLSEEEMAVQRTGMEKELEASERAIVDQRQRALAGAGAGSGDALKMAMETEQQQLEQRERMAESLMAQDVAEKEAELDELDQLVAEQARRQMERRAAVAAPVKQGAESLTDFLDFKRTTDQTADKADKQGAKDASIKLLMDQYGLTEEKAAEAYEGLSENYMELLEN